MMAVVVGLMILAAMPLSRFIWINRIPFGLLLLYAAAFYLALGH